jgi:hypothetical protein
MRRPARSAAAAAALLGVGAAAALAGESPPGEVRTITYKGETYTVREVTAAWQIGEASRNGRALKLVYGGGGCNLGNGRASVEESRDSIRIAVRQDATVDPSAPDGTPCTSDWRAHGLRVRLERPVRGRRIEGGPRIPRGLMGPFRYDQRGDRLIPLVPRVTGLAPGDASQTLTDQWMHVRTRGGYGGIVVSQRPRAGRPAPKGRRPVVLRLR